MSFGLLEEDVLVLDCQSTGATPARSSLLEIGWARARAAHPEPLDPGSVTAHLVALPEGESIPRQVARITGIQQSDLEGAAQPAEAWRALADDAAARGARTVVHCARFEEAFLRALHQDSNPSSPFPLEMICTLEIARRLLPDLPRRGLRALAGYFGLSVPPARRAAEHVAATAFIWAKLARLLTDEKGVTTWGDLCEWLEQPPPGRGAQRAYPMPRALRLDLPDRPGVYRMLRGNGDLLYVGKATSLRQRVNSYFQKQTRIPDRTLEMLTQARDLQVTTTESALEAALLESDEIKRAVPPYNVALRSDQRALCYASRDFDSLADAADARHRVGPLPGNAAASAFAALVGHLAGERAAATFEEGDVAAFFGLPEDRLPDADCFTLGTRLLCEELPAAAVRDRTALVRALYRFGARSWQRRIEEARRARDEAEARGDEAVAEAESADGDAASEGEETVEWTPERVASFLEGVVRQVAHQVRRARWLCALTDASVSWPTRSGTRGEARLLVLERGEVTRRQSVPHGALPPAPPGFARRPRERQRAFDVATYDRLRVLTTELRRLATDRDALAVRLGPKEILDRALLTRKLEWV